MKKNIWGNYFKWPGGPEIEPLFCEKLRFLHC